MATAGAAKNHHNTCTETGAPIVDGAPTPPEAGNGELFWRQHHDHLTPLKTGVHLDLGDPFGIAFEAIEQPDAEFLVRHFAARKRNVTLTLSPSPKKRIIERIFTS